MSVTTSLPTSAVLEVVIFLFQDRVQDYGVVDDNESDTKEN